MHIPNISEAEFRLCLIVWEKEPIASGALAAICANTFGWARTTTHTFIRRLTDRGALKNERGIVTSLISKEAAQDAALSDILSKRFDNSVYSLLVALARRQGLTDSELEALCRIAGAENNMV